MHVYFAIIVFIFGLLMGSFLHATAGRWGSSRSNATRSKCWQCGTVLTWRNLIPLYSWSSQRGKCSACYSKISARYPLVELGTAATYVGLFVTTQSVAQLVFNTIVASIMILIALIDYDRFIIPHNLSLPLAIIAFAQLFLSPITLLAIYPSSIDLLAGPILALFFWGIWAVTRGQGMGFADGTLALSIGWLLGLWQGVTAVLLSFWIGSAIYGGLILFNYLRHKQGAIDMKTAVPFGPFLVLGYLLVSLTNFSLF